MATLEQLNFQLILDDDAFNKKVAQIQKVAGDLNESLSSILNVKGSIVPISSADVESAKNLNKILKDNLRTQKELERIKGKSDSRMRIDAAAEEARTSKEITKAREQEAREVIKTQTAQERLNKLQREHTSLLSKSGRLWREMGSMILTYFSIRGATSLIRTLTRVSAEFEMQRVTLGAILQDTQEANKLFGQLKELAVKSPFQFKDLATYAKQLSAFSIPAKELFETTKMLADVSAGLGVGMDRLVLAYGQIRSASFLRGQEVRQLTEAGIPILEELRKQFVELGEEGISVGDVFDKISKRMVPFEMVEKVFKNMTEEGGKFYKMQEVQAETLKGKISNLTDAYQIMFSEIGDRKQGLLKGAVDMARALAENYEKVGRAIVSIVSVYGAYKAALVAVNILENAVALQTRAHASAGAALGKALQVAIRHTNLYKVALHAIKSINPYVAIGSAIVGVATAIALAHEQQKKFNRELAGIADKQIRDAEVSVKNFKELAKTIKEATGSSNAYREAISKLNNQYGEYLPNLLNEQNALEEIKRLEGEVTEAIYARARAYAEAEGVAKIEDKQGKRVNNAIERIREGLTSSGLMDKAVTDIIEKFKDAVEGQAPRDAYSVLTAQIKDYLGAEGYADWLKNVNIQYGKLKDSASDYARRVVKLNDAMADFNGLLDSRFGTEGYSSAKERMAIERINRDYQLAVDRLDKATMSDAEYKAKMQEEEIARLNAIKKAYEDLNEEAAKEGKAGAWNNKIDEIERKLKDLGPAEQGWIQKLVNPFATGSNKDLMADISDSLSEYADKVRKEYKSVVESLEDAADAYNNLLEQQKKGKDVDAAALQKSEELKRSLEERKTAIENIGGALGISVDDKLKKTSGSGSRGKSKEQTELEKRRDTLKDIYKWYNKLIEAGMENDDAKEFLGRFFPDQKDIIDAEKFKEELIGIANALERYDDKAAQALRDDVGLTEIDFAFDKWKDAKKAADDYEEAMKNWLESSELFGEGSEFNVSKVIDRYQKQLQKIDNEREKMLKLAARDATLNADHDFDEALDAITAKTVTDKANALATANEELRKQAENWVKNWDKIGSIDIAHMADLTTRELDALINELQLFIDKPSDEYFGGMIEAMENAHTDAEGFRQAAVDFAKSLLGQAQEKQWSKTIQQARRYRNALKESVEAMRELAETAGWTGISDLADHLSRAADAALNFMQNLAEGDTLGAVASVVGYVANEMVHLATSAMEYRNMLSEIETEMDALNHTAMLTSGVNSIFGTDTYRALKNAYNLLDLMSGKISGLRDTLGSITAHVDKSKWWQFLLAPTAWYGWFQHFFGKESFTSLLDELGAELFDETGRVNVQVIELLQSKYDKLSASEKVALEQAIQDAKDFNAALDQIDDTMSELVGNVADNFADAIIDQWKEAGDAAADYGEILDDLATQYAKMYIRNNILENVFDPEFEEQLKRMTLGMDAAGVMSLFDEKVKELEDYYPFFEDVLNGLSGYFNTSEADTKNTLGGGIKSITEDTANLLASYINAIRADVAAIRQAVVSGNTNTLPSPTLAEYLTQIQANTYNTAQNTANLLERIDSVMTMSDGPAIRVFM